VAGEHVVKSLQNFDYVFPGHTLNEPGCRYDWLENQGCGLFIVYLDSCLLGENRGLKGDPANMLVIGDIARGKISIEQSQQILEWHNLGLFGKLAHPRKRGQKIPKDLFARSFKAVVMHHYLLESPAIDESWMLRLQQRSGVFRNLAFADFDVLLCGHRHVPDFFPTTYGDNFDDRAKLRHLLNCFRRSIGIHAYPLKSQYPGEQFMTRNLNDLIGILAAALHRNPDLKAEEVITILMKGLVSPEILVQEIRGLVHRLGLEGTEVCTEAEVLDLRATIVRDFTKNQRKELSRHVGRTLRGLVKELRCRPFVQAMCGSSAKVLREGSEKVRGFNVYRIEPKDTRWEFRSERYEWEQDLAAFTIKMHSFQEFPRRKAIALSHHVGRSQLELPLESSVHDTP